MNYPIINKGVTFTEIPGEISVFFEFGGCKQNCKGCHSAEWNSVPIAKDLYTSLEDIKKFAIRQKEQGATAIVLMGGTNNTGVTNEGLIALIEELSSILPVGLYSGLPDRAVIHDYLKKRTRLRWLKTGEWIEDRGGLDKPYTNQLFYERNTLLDGTAAWWECSYIKFRAKEFKNDGK